MNYPVHTLESAPAGARETLAGAGKAFGFVPNLLATMAESPELLKAYLTLGALFDATSFSPECERRPIHVTSQRLRTLTI